MQDKLIRPINRLAESTLAGAQVDDVLRPLIPHPKIPLLLGLLEDGFPCFCGELETLLRRREEFIIRITVDFGLGWQGDYNWAVITSYSPMTDSMIQFEEDPNRAYIMSISGICVGSVERPPSGNGIRYF